MDADRMSGIVIVRTGGEIGIKSRPVRSAYERLILKSIRTRLKAASIPYTKLWRIAGRIYVECEDAHTVALSLSRLFGVSSTSPGVSMDADLNTIVDIGARLARQTLKPGTFAVKCRRVGEHPYSSQDVCRALGEAVLSTGISLRVDLENPDQVLNVEIRDRMAILYAQHHRGPDGFPLGAQNPVLGIIDGSPESLLACWCVMKRGSDLRAIAPASQNMESALDESVERNLRLLAAWKPGGGIRTTIIRMPSDLKPNERDMLLLSVAAGKARRRGIEAVVSGLSPDLESMKKLMALPVYVLYPLVTMDQALASTWASMVGLEAKGPFGRAVDATNMSLADSVEMYLESSKELTVKA
jgi:thiamine biosynthesis protein ThiI